MQNSSMSGDQSGFITQGKYNPLVYSAMSVLESSKFLYMMAESVITTTYGMPCEKYKVGIQPQGLPLPLALVFTGCFGIERGGWGQHALG